METVAWELVMKADEISSLAKKSKSKQYHLTEQVVQFFFAQFILTVEKKVTSYK